MTWEEAPQGIRPEHLSRILGIGANAARDIFKIKGFPIIPGTEAEPVADKMAARMFLLGINIKNQTKESLLYLIYLEMQELVGNNKKGNKGNIENKKNNSQQDYLSILGQ